MMPNYGTHVKLISVFHFIYEMNKGRVSYSCIVRSWDATPVFTPGLIFHQVNPSINKIMVQTDFPRQQVVHKCLAWVGGFWRVWFRGMGICG